MIVQRFGDFGLLVGGRSDLARARQFAAARSEGTRILATHDGSKEVWLRIIRSSDLY